MNFHDTTMGHIFFERQLPQLIRSIDALTAALVKPTQVASLPLEPDPEFLSELYYGNYEPGTFKQTPESAEHTRAINEARDALEVALPEAAQEKLRLYEDTLSMRDSDEIRWAYESGFRTAVQMLVAGLSRPAATYKKSEVLPHER